MARPPIGDDGMDVFERLKRDREALRELMAEVEALAPGARIHAALTLHAAIEERHFYSLLHDSAASKDLALEAMEEHEMIKNQIADLLTFDFDGEEDGGQWSAQFESLRAGVERHIASEEVGPVRGGLATP